MIAVHPDKGGSHEAFCAANDAYQLAVYYSGRGRASKPEM